jgi:hypothetical protein
LGSDAHPNVQHFFLRTNEAFVTSLKSALTF